MAKNFFDVLEKSFGNVRVELLIRSFFAGRSTRDVAVQMSISRNLVSIHFRVFKYLLVRDRNKLLNDIRSYPFRINPNSVHRMASQVGNEVGRTVFPILAFTKIQNLFPAVSIEEPVARQNKLNGELLSTVAILVSKDNPKIKTRRQRNFIFYSGQSNISFRRRQKTQEKESSETDLPDPIQTYWIELSDYLKRFRGIPHGELQDKVSVFEWIKMKQEERPRIAPWTTVEEYLSGHIKKILKQAEPVSVRQFLHPPQ